MWKFSFLFNVSTPYFSLFSRKEATNTDKKRIYITLDDGNWNYWNGETWIAGGQYLSPIQNVEDIIAQHSSNLAIAVTNMTFSYDETEKVFHINKIGAGNFIFTNKRYS